MKSVLPSVQNERRKQKDTEDQPMKHLKERQTKPNPPQLFGLRFVLRTS